MTEATPRLDPTPWVHSHYDQCPWNGSRARTSEGIGNIFDPRPDYSQNEEDYAS